MNYFGTESAAKHYLDGRPDFHSIATEHICRLLGTGSKNKLERALDIACGTGLSTKALLPIAKNISGTDKSEEMLRIAHKHSRIQYAVAAAEHQPYADQSFDLITVCSAVHWFDPDAFLVECSRLLKDKAWIVLYDNFFLGTMGGNYDFSAWYTQHYLMKFPPPPRNTTYPWHKLQLAHQVLRFEKEEEYTNYVSFDKKGLIQYLITQSNVIARVVDEDITYTMAMEWLDAELAVFFPDEIYSADFVFGNWIKYIQKEQSDSYE